MRRLWFSGLVLGVCVLFGVAAYVGAASRDGGWREIAWPFPRDGWPAGRAFRCVAAACGGGIELYVRPKLGFCNCDSGVADDDEVDRVADLDLISAHFQPLEPGNPVRISGMLGRLRNYTLQMPDGARAATGIAVSHRCDLMVIAAQGKAAPPALQRAALDFLDTAPIADWIDGAMRGR